MLGNSHGWPFMTCHTHRSAYLSTHVRKYLSAVDDGYHWDSQMAWSGEQEAAEYSALCGPSIPYHLLQASDHKKRDRRDRKKQRWWTIQESSVLWTHWASGTGEREVVRTSPTEAQAGPNPGMERRGGYQVLPLARNYWPLIAAGRGRVCFL